MDADYDECEDVLLSYQRSSACICGCFRRRTCRGGQDLAVRKKIRVSGIVQGVGMRPFVYSLAERHGVSGWVLNDSRGVEIEAEGADGSVERFVRALSEEAPPLARITDVAASEIEPTGEVGFEIRTSASGESRRTLVSPDCSVCEDCLREMRDPADRRSGYPFINCTNCGPRYTIIRDVPYDREKTTMASFEMCPDCRAEYEDPRDRRFHAQPVACARCGPKVWLADASGRPVETDDPMARAADALGRGLVVAVKGLGGFHLACDATNEEAVRRLRARKAREEKPLAVMCPDLAAAGRLCEISPGEEALLSSIERPIVLMRKRSAEVLAESVAPRNPYLGVMLPYTPLHYLLMEHGPGVLVMTSGNVTDEPICHENEDAVRRLSGIADLFLLHDREIHIRTDDSVTRVLAGAPRPVRRARGYVPRPVFLEMDCPPVLALGPELKNTICLVRGREAFLSHHIGDLKNAAALASLKQAVGHLEGILEVEPGRAACDLHPAYMSTRHAFELGLPVTAVQHHHAHIASCLAENGRRGPVIGVALDGTGHGADGAVWGGEFLVADLEGHRRAGHIEYVPLPGGDRAAEEPARMALAYLYAIHGAAAAELDLPVIERMGRGKARTLCQMMEKGANSPPTSSAGRLFDAAAALAGLRDRMSYEGQAAMELEGAADPDEDGSWPCRVVERDGVLVVLAKDIVAALVGDLARGAGAEALAARFHNSVLDMVVDVVKRLRERTGLAEVALSGGCWQNARLLAGAVERLGAEGFAVLTHTQVPANDGGVSLGQAVVCASGGGTALRG
jgi:hydrogenase maturation protein HypF